MRRNATRMLVLALPVLAMIASPGFSPAAQKKDDLVSIQRDIADLVDKVAKLQKSQDEKMAAITAMVQQSMDASAKVSASLAALQNGLVNGVNQSLADAQRKANEQHAETSAKLDTLSQNAGALGETVVQLSSRVKEMNGKLDNLNDLVKTLNAPPPIPAPAAPAASATNGAPAGWNPSDAYSRARSDYTAGHYDLAITGFLEYIKYAPRDDENAPNSQYYIAESYYAMKHYDDAAQAFGDVVDRFSANPKTCESRYMKAVALQDAKHKEDAVAGYKDFLTSCPADPNREAARDHMAQLTGPARANSKSKGKSK